MTTNHASVRAVGAITSIGARVPEDMRERLPCHIRELSPLQVQTSAPLETRLSVYSPMPHTCAWCQSNICQQGAEYPQKGRRKWMGKLAEKKELWERVRLKRFTTMLWRKLCEKRQPATSQT